MVLLAVKITSRASPAPGNRATASRAAALIGDTRRSVAPDGGGRMNGCAK